MKKIASIRTVGLAFLAAWIVFGWGHPSEAVARWDGMFFLDDTVVTQPDARRELFRTGMVLSVKPAVKYGANFRVNLQVDYTDTGADDRFNTSPLGDLSIDWSAQTWSVTLQHLRTINITSTARLVENTTSRFALSLMPAHGPRLLASYSMQDTKTDSIKAQTRKNLSLLTDYRYQWFTFRSGYNKQIRDGRSGGSVDSDNFQVGATVQKQLAPRTSFFGDLDLNHFNSLTTQGFGTDSTSRAVRLGVTSRPGAWLGLDGSYSQDVNDLGSGSSSMERTEIRTSDLTATLYPVAGVRIWGTVGNRLFDDLLSRRSIDYTTMAGAWNASVTEHVWVDFLLSRTDESDPMQGENTRKSLVFNTTLDLAPGATLRLNLNLNHNIFPGFVDEARYDASGPLVDRDLYDDRPAGFTFLDTDLNQVYTKNSAVFADWSSPEEAEFVGNAPYSVNKSVQLNTRVTPKMTFTANYSGTTSSEELDLGRTDSHVTNGVITYRANSRMTYSYTGTVSQRQFSPSTRSRIATVSYQYLRGHRMNLNYGRRVDGERVADTFTANLRFSLRRQGRIEMTYSSSRILEENTKFFRVRFARTF